MMITRDEYEARIADLELQVEELKVHIPRMLSIMLKMQAQLEAQQASQPQRPRRPPPSPKQPFTLDDGWLVA